MNLGFIEFFHILTLTICLDLLDSEGNRKSKDISRGCSQVVHFNKVAGSEKWFVTIYIHSRLLDSNLVSWKLMKVLLYVFNEIT